MIGKIEGKIIVVVLDNLRYNYSEKIVIDFVFINSYGILMFMLNF